MIAYKFLGAGSRGLFSGARWPSPAPSGAPGAWIEASGPLEVCRSGVHVCRPADLPYWLAEELWEVEAEGDSLEGPNLLVVRRARLVRRIEAWSEGGARELALACAGRARSRAEAAPAAFAARLLEYADDAAHCASAGEVPVTAYIAAIAAGAAEAALGRDGEAGVALERAWQADWIARRVGITLTPSS